MRNAIAYALLAILAFLAIAGKSAVMFVSVFGMGLAFRLTRGAPQTKQLGATALTAVATSLIAEAIHTLYHLLETGPAGSGVDEGGFFVSATLVGLINAVVFVSLLLLLDWAFERSKSQRDN